MSRKGKPNQKNHVGEILPSGIKYISLTEKSNKYNQPIYNVLCPICGNVFEHNYTSKLSRCSNCQHFKKDYTGKTNSYGVKAITKTDKRKRGQVVYILKCPLCGKEYEGIHFLKQKDCGCNAELRYQYRYNENGDREELNHEDEILSSGVVILSRTTRFIKAGDKYNRLYKMKCPKCGKLFEHRYLINVEDCGEHSNEKRTAAFQETKNERGFVFGTFLPAIESEKLSKTNTSGTKGVSWDNSKKRWRAYITFQKCRYEIGKYTDINIAIEQRKKAESILDEFLDWYNSLSGEEKKKAIENDNENALYFRLAFKKRMNEIFRS